MKHALGFPPLHLLLRHARVVEVNVQGRDRSARRCPEDPARFLLTHKFKSPLAVPGTREVPCLTVRTQGPQVHDLEPTDIEIGVVSCSSLEATLAVHLKDCCRLFEGLPLDQGANTSLRVEVLHAVSNQKIDNVAKQRFHLSRHKQTDHQGHLMEEAVHPP